MKYLKMFDSVSSSYSKILQPEYSELLGTFMRHRIKFDDSEKEMLAKYFDDNEFIRYTFDPGFVGRKNIMGIRLNLIFRFGKVRHVLEVDKIDDEWFLVRKLSNGGKEYYFPTDLSFWKCDQFDGLMDFFRSIGVNNISEKMDLKLNELYRTDRSGTFKKDYVKILTPIEYSRMDKEVDDSFISFDFINNLFKELSPLLKDEKFEIRNRNFSHPTKSLPTAYASVSRAKAYNVYEVVFETITEDLSWGGLYPPLLYFYWELEIVPLEDEYFLICCGFSKRDSEIEYIKYKTNMNHRRILMVDGRENLLPVIKDMIKNYDLLS